MEDTHAEIVIKHLNTKLMPGDMKRKTARMSLQPQILTTKIMN